MSGTRARRRLHVLAPDGARLLVVVDEPPTSVPGAPTLVLVHGWTTTHAAWDRVLDDVLARRDVRVVRYDQRGHGGSDPGGPQRRTARPGRRASVRALGDDLATVLRAVVPTGPIVLGGHSMGGMTVMAFAGLHPDLVRGQVAGVALVSTTAGGLAARVSRSEDVVMRLAARVPGARTRGLVTATSHRKLVFGDRPDPADVRESLQMLGATRLTTVGTYHAALSRHDERESLAALRGVPVRIVVGDRDQLTPVAHAHELVRLLPGADLDVLPGLGHMLVYEAPQRVAAHLRGLLDASTSPTEETR